MSSDIQANPKQVEYPDYDLVCPSCRGRCVGKTYPCGGESTYRNPYIRLGVRRILCPKCGIVAETKTRDSLEYLLWYRIPIGKNILWANNEKQLRAIRDYLMGKLERNNAGFYASPKWLLKKTNRAKAIIRIDQALMDTSLK